MMTRGVFHSAACSMLELLVGMLYDKQSGIPMLNGYCNSTQRHKSCFAVSPLLIENERKNDVRPEW